MIKPINKREYPLPQSSQDWPDSKTESKALFTPRAPLRKLVVMIDEHLIYTSRPVKGKELTKKEVLSSLLTHKYIDSYKYKKGGPPKAVKPIKTKFLGEKMYDGWVVASPSKDDQKRFNVNYSLNGRYHVSACFNFHSISRNNLSVNEDFLPLDIAEQALRADIYITNNKSLLEKNNVMKERGVTICTPAEALPLIGLYLRAQGEFLLCSWPDFQFRFNKGLYYWVGMRELLPEAWRWFSACVYYSSANNDDYLLHTAGALLGRMSRVLQYRDQIHIALNLPANNDTNDDALSHLDIVLFFLMGAYDSIARVSNFVLETGIKDRNVGWQKEGWIKEIGKKCPTLEDLIKPGSKGYNILTILRLLRNSVHGAALQGITVFQDGYKEMYIGLPSGDEERIIQAIEQLGGKNIWGITELGPGRALISPTKFVDKLIEEAIPLLNQIMKSTPVERLKGLDYSQISFGPPTPKNGRHSEFSKSSRLSIRWQLGF